MSDEIETVESLPLVESSSATVYTMPVNSKVSDRTDEAAFIEVCTTLGPRCWIRKSHIAGVDEVRASSWDDIGSKTEQPTAIVYTVGGKSWRISGDAAAFVASLRQAEL